ncbi:MAG TPA: DUF5074 domain-containing protein, partial [Bacteroidia bacterium]|nr:DUF5074 domain-containing protein [Bacteroidia bacterium]
SKAYVTDLFSGSISIINLSNDSISGSISLPGWTEAMKLLNNEVFVCNAGKNNLYVIDPATDQVTDSIAIAPGANSIISDLNGKLWVLCFGDYFTSTPGGLYRIDPSTHLVEQAYPFTTSDYPTRLCANGTGDTLYYINTGVYRMPVASASLPSSAFLTPSGTQSFYGLNVQPQTGEIFVADAQDYSAKGHLLRFTRNGVLLADKMVGVAPAGIYFY